MAGKRQATSDLNHDNWDREEQPEERGTFRTATEEELKNRVIKKAKRKIALGTGNETVDTGSGTKSVFSSFSGFGKPSAASATPTSSSTFSFLSKIPSIASATSGVVSSSTTTTNATPTFSFGISSAATTITPKCAENSKTSFSLGSSNVNVAGNKRLEYYRDLTVLNQAVSEWIKTHVDKNPVCILSPIFKDYEKYLEKIENENKKEAKETEATDATENTLSGIGVESLKCSISSSNNAVSTNCTGDKLTTSETEAKAKGFSFEIKKPDDTSSIKPAITPSFSFVLSPSTSSTAATSTSFSFGNQSNSTNESTTPPKTFSFTSGGTPFTFGNIKPPDVVSGNTTSGIDQNEEEDEEPPKNVFKQVVEDDAVYSKKCKVFVKKDANFVDKGVGTLHLKPVKSSDKTQLLVRADTNLGNILVNLILNSGIPTQRIGKNNVMMVCLPTPDLEKPTTMLLRVKTSDEANELLENIDKYKK